jgi:hypothetical protein
MQYMVHFFKDHTESYMVEVEITNFQGLRG